MRPDVLQEFTCGCAITESRGRITSVAHCDAHWELRSEDKTLKQMAGEVRAMQPQKFRVDGWPLCPVCGEDEVYSVVSLSWIEPRRPLIDDLAGGPFGCYRCAWRIERLLSRADAVA